MVGYSRILLLEDHPITLLTFTLELQEAGFEVLGAGSAPEALQLLRTATEGLQAVVIDLEVRGGDGYALGRAALAVNTSMVLVYTAQGPRPEFASMAPRGSRLLAKPAAPRALSALLRERLPEDGAP